MRGTLFGNIHSADDLELLQASFEASPAEPKTSYLELEGGDGSLDLSEALGRLYFKDRTLSWIFKLYPGQNWEDKQTEVSNQLSGKACFIVLDSDPEYYYTGRVKVSKYEKDKLLRQITVTAQVRPWKFKKEETVLTVNGSGFVRLPNGRRPACPEITTTKAAKLSWGIYTADLEPGTHTIPELQLDAGETVVKIESTGLTTFKYQEGDL